jgi:hypothetical protein
MARRLKLTEVVRLSLALAVGPHANLVGLGLGLLMVAGVALATWVNAPIGPGTPTDGVIEVLNLSRREPRAVVSIHGNRAIVRSYVLRQCRVGDRISLERRKAAVGFRYTVPMTACSARRP